ncbi:MAG: hypothetical protein ACWA44_02795 [Thiotrichales bacterium]
MKANEVIVISPEQLHNLITDAVQKANRKEFIKKHQRPYLYTDEVVNVYFYNEKLGKSTIGTTKLAQLVEDGFLPKHYVGNTPVYYLEDLDKLPKGAKFKDLKAAA